MALIAASANSKLAGEALIGNQNLIAARNMLMKLGMINFANGEASLTDTGQQVARDEDIVTDTGELSDNGRELIGQQSAAPQPEMPLEPAPMESYSGSFIKELLNLK